MNWSKSKDYSEEPNLDKLLQHIESSEEVCIIHVDLETCGTDPFCGKPILTVAVSWKLDQAIMVKLQDKNGYVEKVIDQLRFVLTNKKVRVWFSNGKFDLSWLLQHFGIECTNFTMDTTLVGSLLDENRSNSLTNHAKIYSNMGGYDLEFNRSYDKAQMDLVLQRSPEDFLLYACGDVDAGRQVGLAMKEELLKDKRLTKFYLTVLHPAARAFEKVENFGVCFDSSELSHLEKSLQEEIAVKTAEALSYIPQDILNEYGSDLDKKGLVGQYMFKHGSGLTLIPKITTEKTKQPSTAKQHLMMFVEHPTAGAFVKALADRSSAQKMLSTYVTGFKKHIRNDQKLHPSYMLYRGAFEGARKSKDMGTVTGRLSATDPAIQTVPKRSKWAKLLRKCFTAPEGFKVFEADFSQGELRIAAALTNDERMLKAYSLGLDLHSITGADLAGMSVKDFLELKNTDRDRFGRFRYGAKARNFGLLYMQGWRGFKNYAELNYGLKMTPEEAMEAVSQWHSLYPGVRKWWNKQEHYVCKLGLVRSPLGRLRHLPDALKGSNDKVKQMAIRQSVNSPVQSTLSDMTLWSISLLSNQENVQIVAAIHDAIVGYVKIDDGKMDERLLKVQETMENLPFSTLGWNPSVSFPVEIEVGDTLGTVSEWKAS